MTRFFVCVPAQSSENCYPYKIDGAEVHGYLVKMEDHPMAAAATLRYDHVQILNTSEEVAKQGFEFLYADAQSSFNGLPLNLAATRLVSRDLKCRLLRGDVLLSINSL